MKKKWMIRLLTFVMLLTVLLSGLGTVNAAQTTNNPSAETTVPTQPVEADPKQTPAAIYPIDLRFTDCAVLELPQVEAPLPAPVGIGTIPGEEEAPPEADGGDGNLAAEGIDSLPEGGDPTPQPTETYRIFRYREEGGLLGYVRIQVWQQSEDRFQAFTGTLTPGDGVKWDSAEVPMTLAALEEGQLDDLQWIPCTEETCYALHTAMTQCMVMGRRVFYTNDTHTMFQIQDYDDAGVLTGVIPLAWDAGQYLEDGALSELQWMNDCFPTLEEVEPPPYTVPETYGNAAMQERINDYEAQLRELRQQKQQGKILVIVLGAAAALLLITNLITLLRRPKRPKRSKTRGDATTKTETNPGAAGPLPQHGVVHNIGRRSGQQDSFDVINCAAGTLAVVADGMGGLSDGDKVSQKIVATMREDSARLHPGHTDGVLYQLAAHANAEVNRMLGAARQYKCGSTLLAVLVENGMMQWVTVGDSRIYLYRGGSLLQINREHIYKSELLERAVNGKMSFADVARDSQRDRVTSFLGMGELKHVDGCLNKVKLVKGDRILLMSDGVFNALSNDEIAGVIRSAPSTADAAQLLEQQVLQKQVPNQDNFTCVILEV